MLKEDFTKCVTDFRTASATKKKKRKEQLEAMHKLLSHFVTEKRSEMDRILSELGDSKPAAVSISITFLSKLEHGFQL